MIRKILQKLQISNRGTNNYMALCPYNGILLQKYLKSA
jgi:hypothetical protein